DFVVRLTPYGVFAIAASAAGTLGVAGLGRIEGYLVVYVALSSLLALWILPGLVAALTPLAWRGVVGAGPARLITALATGGVCLVLPILVERSRRLLAAVDPGRRDPGGAVEVLIPASLSFPSSAKLLSLSFLLFAGWFSGQDVSPAQYPTLVGSGVASLFGS